MVTLIDGLLALARAGRTIDDREPVSLSTLSDECWANVETAEADITTTVDQIVEADRSRLKQLLENLFRNAVEHGGRAVTVTVSNLESKNGFYVEDDGAGPPKGNHTRILEPGYTTDEGTGLGLNIVEQIANAHGWDVSVSEGRAGGIRFEFTGIESMAQSDAPSDKPDRTQDTRSEGSDD
jgi:signal transduction histidine kinase